MSLLVRGRINRRTYWCLLGGLTIGLMLFRLFGQSATISEVVLVLICVPRLHDIGRSGWWVLTGVALEVIGIGVAIALVPHAQLRECVGIVVLLMLALMVWLGLLSGDPGENSYGPPPAGFLGLGGTTGLGRG